MDEGTGLTILGSAIGSAKLVEKILGPTAEYLGEGFKDWTKKRVTNICRIFSIAAERLGDQLKEKSGVPPRVLKYVIDDGSFCDDELSAEYFGGILASSRKGQFGDDRGVYFLDLIKRLPSYELRTHYIFYSIFRTIYMNLDDDLGDSRKLKQMGVFVPLDVYNKSMNINQNDKQSDLGRPLGLPTMRLLSRELLIANRWAVGHTEFLSDWLGESFPGCGYIYAASAVGIELFLWAYGKGGSPLRACICSKIELPQLSEIIIPEGSRKIAISKE